MSVGPDKDKMGPVEILIVPVKMVPESIGPTSMGPNYPDVGPISVSSQKTALWKPYTSQSHLVSLNHSKKNYPIRMLDARPCMLDNKRSGGRCKILRCRTTLSKKNKDNNVEEDANDGPNCPHMLLPYALWTKYHTEDYIQSVEIELGQKHSQKQICLQFRSDRNPSLNSS